MATQTQLTNLREQFVVQEARLRALSAAKGRTGQLDIAREAFLEAERRLQAARDLGAVPARWTNLTEWP
jgi:hypothetical protein